MMVGKTIFEERERNMVWEKKENVKDKRNRNRRERVRGKEREKKEEGMKDR